MKLFFKHLLRSLRSSPYQPLLILLTITLSVASAVTAFRIRDIFYAYAEEKAELSAELGDVIITVAPDADVRMIFAEDAEREVGDKAEVLGEYMLTAFCKGDNESYTAISASAVDMEQADLFYRFAYSEYSGFDEENVNSSAVISKRLAEKLSLSVGDKLSLLLLGEEKEYRVGAIAEEDGLFSGRDLMISSAGVVRILASRVPAIAALGDSFIPCNRLLIRANSGYTAEEIFDTLSSSPAFDDAVIELSAVDPESYTSLTVENVAVTLLAILITLLSAILIGTSLSLIRAQRAMEYALFRSVGATGGQTSRLMMTEGMLYAVAGGIAGILMSAPMLDAAVGLFKWNTKKIYVGLSGLLFGLCFSLLLMLICTYIDISGSKKRTLDDSLRNDNTYPSSVRSRQSAFSPLLTFALFACFISITFLTPIKYRYIPGSCAALLLLRLLYLSIPIAVGFLAKKYVCLLEKKDKSGKRGVCVIALKEAQTDGSLVHAGQLLGVLIAILLTVSVCSGALERQQNVLDGLFVGEYLIAGAPSSLIDELEQSDAVEGVASFGFVENASLPNGVSAMALMVSGDTASCFSSDIGSLPLGKNEVALSEGIATFCGVTVGDSVQIGFFGRDYTLTVREILDLNANLITVSADTVPASGTLHSVRLKSNTDQTDATVVSTVESYGAILLDKKELTGSISDTLHGFIELSGYALALSVLLALVGCANTLSAQRKATRRQRELLRLCGMERSALAKKDIISTLFVFAVTAALSLVFGIFICLTVNISINSFGLLLF